MNLSELGITKEEVLNLAATKVADEFIDANDTDVADRVTRLVNERVEEAVGDNLNQTVKDALDREMEAVMQKTFTPVDMWGDSTGKPTTLRDALHERAKEYWLVKVDKKGNPTSYGGSRRADWVFHSLAQDEFAKAIRECPEEVVSAFKAALKDDMAAKVREHIDKLIHVGKKG